MKGWKAPFARAGLWVVVTVAATAASLVSAVISLRHPLIMAAILAVALYLTYRRYRLYLGRLQEGQRRAEEASALNLRIIEALTLAISAQDGTSHEGLRRLQEHASVLARSIGLTESEQQAVAMAVLLRDIGKLAVPQHILAKAASLTPVEIAKVRTHPEVGAAILRAIGLPPSVVPAILAHHERWDGSGYPAGHAGQGIPVAARIVGLLDYYDALVHPRPRRGALSFEQASQCLRAEAGRGLDPVLVSTFLDYLRRSPRDAEAVADRRSVAAPPEQQGGDVLEDIAMARREVQLLYEIAQALGGSLAPEDTMPQVARVLQALVPYSCCALHLQDDEGGLRLRFATGVAADAVRRKIRPRQERGVEDAPVEPADVHPRAGAAGDFASALVAPIVASGQRLGTLSVFAEAPCRYGDDHARRLTRVAEQAAAVMANALRFERTHQDSLTDPLTGLANKRFLQSHCERELDRARRTRAPLSVLLLDVDGFKQINDTFGHRTGDRTLVLISERMRALVRPYDACVRYAGDEFVLVLPDCSSDEAEGRRRELQAAIEAIVVPTSAGSFHPGVSIGAASWPDAGEELHDLLEAADRAMYEDKARRKSPTPDFAA